MMHAKHALLFALVGLVNIAKSKIVVTEIMLNSPKATDPKTQWVELHNTGTSPVPLDGWNFDYKGNGKAYPAIKMATTKIIGANGYVVIGNNAVVATNGGVQVDIAVDFEPFAKDGSGDNVITLYNADFVEESGVDWQLNDAVQPERNYKWVPGASLARIDALAQDDASNWSPLTSFINCNTGLDKGTPGNANNFVCSASTAPPMKGPSHAPVKAPTPPPKATATPKATPPPKASTSTLPPKTFTTAPKAPIPKTNPSPAPNDKVPVRTTPPKIPTPTLPPKANFPTPPPKATVPPLPSTFFSCGLFRLGLFCFDGCGLLGRLLRFCPK